jgi:hypothetical protein
MQSIDLHQTVVEVSPAERKGPTLMSPGCDPKEKGLTLI